MLRDIFVSSSPMRHCCCYPLCLPFMTNAAPKQGLYPDRNIKKNTQRKQEFTDGSCDALSCSAIEFPPYQGSGDEEIGGGRVGGRMALESVGWKGGLAVHTLQLTLTGNVNNRDE